MTYPKSPGSGSQKVLDKPYPKVKVPIATEICRCNQLYRLVMVVFLARVVPAEFKREQAGHPFVGSHPG
jgi:hypothetical protein